MTSEAHSRRDTYSRTPLKRTHARSERNWSNCPKGTSGIEQSCARRKNSRWQIDRTGGNLRGFTNGGGGGNRARLPDRSIIEFIVDLLGPPHPVWICSNGR